MSTKQWVWQTQEPAWVMRSRVAHALEYQDLSFPFELIDNGVMKATVLTATVTPRALEVEVHDPGTDREFILIIPYDNDPDAKASMILVHNR